MAKKNLVIQHDLSKLDSTALVQYLRDVSEFIGLDPDLNGLDTIWMENEHGPGRSLVVYARRGTAEILREKQNINVSSLSFQEVGGSIVFTAIGKNGDARQEVAIGAKSISGLQGKALDNAIKSASTQALRRLTMQFTKLGILDESEIEAVQGSLANPAAGAQLSGSPVVIPPQPLVIPNNAPGRDITQPLPVPQMSVPTKNFAENQSEMIKEAMQQIADKKADIPAPATPATPAAAPVAVNPEAVKNAAISEQPSEAPKRRGRKPRNTVSMSDVEPETVTSQTETTRVVAVPAAIIEAVRSFPDLPPQIAPQPAPAPAQAPVAAPAVPVSGTSALNQGTDDFPGKPTADQMSDYRKRVSVYTSELPSSENMGSVQKMRAFITKMSGAAPQFMTVDQWEEMLSWFEGFVARNQVKGLVKYINDSLGVK